ncbi:flagellar basal body-associated protein FliL [Psychromonas ossibalaenae]|uniref:flagellar basal body-associated protein FliL n=1 Tax=Psychromonas ossibalaenae TaxID=444922 RepID=UPI000372FB7F|nr:flagellar basal body-associated protein FliL [Psychromonas ossibalaenae]
MAEEENEELSLEEGTPAGGGKKKLIIIVAAVVLLLAAGGAAYFFLFSGEEEAAAEQTEGGSSEEQVVESLAATYVAMPRPFVFNVMDGKRDRLVQIKVQLMVRGSANEALAKKHIPLLEGALVRVFGAATVQQLRDPAGKELLRVYALKALNEATTKLENKELIDSVLFTGFVLQ